MKDNELLRITVPTLLLTGDQEVQYDAGDAVFRARTVIPDIDAQIVPNAGHGLPLEQPEEVNGRIIAFLGQQKDDPYE